MPRGQRKTTAKKETEAKVEEILLEEEPKPIAIEEPKKVVTEPKADKKDIEIENLKAQLSQLKEMMAQQSAQPHQIIVTSDNSERVWFLWMAEVAEDNQILIGENGQYGRIVGKTGTFYVPKNDLSRVMDSAMRYYLNHRWMIVLSGLTDDEREALGVNYKDGEIMDEKVFRNIAKMDKKELLEVFPGLCEPHKEMVASKIHEAYMNKKNVDRETVVALNKIYPNVAFKDILEDMNAADME